VPRNLIREHFNLSVALAILQANNMILWLRQIAAVLFEKPMVIFGHGTSIILEVLANV
jgi:hypothetical protein